MGNYINTGNAGFQSSRNDEYVDKSGLISIVNGTLFTKRRFSCVSRCRRFGKSMAAEMLCAYYDQSCDSRSLFADLEIASDPSFEKHLNKYPVIYLDMTNFVSKKEPDVVRRLDKDLLTDICKAYPDIPTEGGDKLINFLFVSVRLQGSSSSLSSTSGTPSAVSFHQARESWIAMLAGFAVCSRAWMQ